MNCVVWLLWHVSRWTSKKFSSRAGGRELEQRIVAYIYFESGRALEINKQTAYFVIYTPLIPVKLNIVFLQCQIVCCDSLPHNTFLCYNLLFLFWHFSKLMIFMSLIYLNIKNLIEEGGLQTTIFTMLVTTCDEK